MKIDRLTLRNYRNISETTIEAGPHLNFLFGGNGQGKTSILEAINYFASLRSFRGSKTPEVISWQQAHSEVICVLKDANWETQLKLVFAFTDADRQKATKVAFINGKPFKSSTQYLTQRFGNVELGFHAVVFNPADHDLIRGEPAIRRAYLDRVLAAENIEYLKAYSHYQRILEQRNAVLKNPRSPANQTVLDGFTESLADSAARITTLRFNWIQRLQKHLDPTLRQIAPEQPFLGMIYQSHWAPQIEGLCSTNNNLEQVHFAGQTPPPSLDQLKRSFWQKISEMREAEWRSGHSLVGPHRDDWSLYLGSQMLKGHGSQGEVRSALLALKLCEVDLFTKETGHRPLFLLDDFSSELDRHRREFLIQFLLKSDLQVFISTTESFLDPRFSESSPLLKRFWIKQGQAHLNELEEKDLWNNPITIP